jgi:hypothetical protein
MIDRSIDQITRTHTVVLPTQSLPVTCSATACRRRQWDPSELACGDAACVHRSDRGCSATLTSTDSILRPTVRASNDGASSDVPFCVPARAQRKCSGIDYDRISSVYCKTKLCTEAASPRAVP